jgi:EAL domain-containing protein (putative c-di-GMP-specific phosphodiesterase class I)
VKVYFQPIYSATNERVVAAEALMRIEDPQLGLLMPGEFIPLAETSGLISRLTMIVLDKVCRFIAANQDILGNLEHVSVNISSEDFSSSEVTASLMQTIRNHRLDPRKICFELTESVVMDSFEEARSRCLELSRFGIKLALDDFGTGYANLESLVNIPFAVVKVDRSVVSNSVNNFQLLSLIALMLERLGKEIVAEGVETREQLGFVQAAGVDRVQGFYFSKPVPEDQFLNLVRYDNAKR